MNKYYVLQVDKKFYGSGGMDYMQELIDDYLQRLYDRKQEINFKIVELKQYIKENQIVIESINTNISDLLIEDKG